MILVMGSHGQVATELKALSPSKFFFTSRKEINLLEPDSLPQILKNYKPELIINCTAYNYVDKAEVESTDSFLINAESLRLIGEYSKESKCAVIHISSDFVFDGLNGPYDENDQKNPINQYGKSKSLGEDYLLQNVEKLLILRTSWVYSNFGNNFFNSIKNSFMQNKKIYGATDIIGSPTRAFTIANFIASNYQKFLDCEFKRIYHICDSGFITRYDFIFSILNKIAEKFSLPCPEIIKVENNFFKLPAQRPLNSSLKNGNIVKDFDFIINDWEGELKKEIERLKI
ncbi:NAD(P)-dependent oxidoreductase [Gammaproteobacteria bacterium]|nr:NAD(P)-dependent oxidoreductase [Gammaproteobacteria bacterium]